MLKLQVTSNQHTLRDSFYLMGLKYILDSSSDIQSKGACLHLTHTQFRLHVAIQARYCCAKM